ASAKQTIPASHLIARRSHLVFIDPVVSGPKHELCGNSHIERIGERIAHNASDATDDGRSDIQDLIGPHFQAAARRIMSVR
ncbi:MAG: hypothetical protein AAFR01_05790, partial [Pseudomonadota bacterium]